MPILSVHRDDPEPYSVVEMEDPPYSTIREYWTAHYAPDDRPETFLGRTATVEEAMELASAHRAQHNSGHGLRPEDWDTWTRVAYIADPTIDCHYAVERHELG